MARKCSLHSPAAGLSFFLQRTQIWLDFGEQSTYLVFNSLMRRWMVFAIGAHKGPFLFLQELLAVHSSPFLVVFRLEYGNDLLSKGSERPAEKALLVEDFAS